MRKSTGSNEGERKASVQVAVPSNGPKHAKKNIAMGPRNGITRHIIEP